MQLVCFVILLASSFVKFVLFVHFFSVSFPVFSKVVLLALSLPAASSFRLSIGNNLVLCDLGNGKLVVVLVKRKCKISIY